MPFTDPPPRLSKWPFLAGDAVLLTAAWVVSTGAAHPMGDLAIGAVVCCVAIAAVLGAIPFLLDYTRRQDEALDERQRSLEALARTITEAAEQISITTKGFHDFHSKWASALETDKEALQKELETLRSSESERLESTTDRVAAITAEWGRIEATTVKHAAAAKATLIEFDKRISALKAAQAPQVEDKSPTPALPPVPEPEAVTPVDEPAASLPAAPVDQPPVKTVRKRTAKKAREDSSADSTTPEPEPSLPLDSAVPEFSQVAPEDTAPIVSVSDDGSTRVIATAYIGIGNRLFIRGDGPGLSWERGVPLQFVSIGKWRWETAEAAAPIRFKLYKNDEVECTAPNALPLEPGQQQEVTAVF